MDIQSRYIIRKTRSWRAYDLIPSAVIIVSTIFTIVSPILIIVLIINRELIMWKFNWEVILQNQSRNIIFHKFFPIFTIICFWRTMFLSIKILRYMLKLNNVKSFKKSWWWIIKKLQISSIERFVSHQKWWSNWYYLQTNEWFTQYCSDLIKDWEIESVLINPDFDKIYKKYWYEYDKNETHKKDVLNEIDKRKTEEKYEAKNWWLLKKLVIKWWNFFSKNDRNIVETWYQTPYLIINWHKISVWDNVDVYIDPKNEKIYWMDIDFLFNK